MIRRTILTVLLLVFCGAAAAQKYPERRAIRSIICATDSGREGELIFRYIYEMAGCQKPVDRGQTDTISLPAMAAR